MTDPEIVAMLRAALKAITAPLSDDMTIGQMARRLVVQREAFVIAVLKAVHALEARARPQPGEAGNHTPPLHPLPVKVPSSAES